MPGDSRPEAIAADRLFDRLVTQRDSHPQAEPARPEPLGSEPSRTDGPQPQAPVATTATRSEAAARRPSPRPVEPMAEAARSARLHNTASPPRRAPAPSAPLGVRIGQINIVVEAPAPRRPAAAPARAADNGSRRFLRGL